MNLQPKRSKIIKVMSDLNERGLKINFASSFFFLPSPRKMSENKTENS